MSEPGLDEEKLQTLGSWATGLRSDPRPEVAAAGRAIELLIEEVERLHVLLWDRRLYPPAGTMDDTGGEEVPDGRPGTTLDQTLRRRLGLLRRGSDNPHP